jgi:hypothetical protein
VQVYCELETVAYLKGLPYIALSYSWGTSTETRPISIGGQLHNTSASLEEAIRRSRDDKAEVLLWCDQLCINQRDDVGKSQQIQRMKDIYSDAWKVVAWLRPGANDSDMCIASLKYMGRDEILDKNGLTKDTVGAITDLLVEYEDEE